MGLGAAPSRFVMWARALLPASVQVLQLCREHGERPGHPRHRLRIEARIGRGGMGEVDRAEQLSLGRKVALKVLRPDLAADDGFRRRFLRESMIAAGIDHPDVIPIYDAGEVDGCSTSPCGTWTAPTYPPCCGGRAAWTWPAPW